MKKLFLMLLLAAPVLFSSCSKEETTISGKSAFDNIEFDKRLPVTKSELVQFEVMRTLYGDSYEYIVFKNNVAGVLTTDLQNKPKTYAYCTEWAISNTTITFVPEKGNAMSYTITKENKKLSSNSYTITVYLKDSKGQEFAYEVTNDGSNHSLAEGIWSIINAERAK
jgi:hypothetical protein